MNRFAIVEPDGTISNLIMWDGVAPYVPPNGCTLVQDVHCEAQVGGTYLGGVWTAAPVEVTEP